MNPWRGAQHQVRQWWMSRQEPRDVQILHQRNVYILPTLPGLFLGITLLVLLLASINFQLNLGYALTFLLAGCTLVAMHAGHATLRGLELQLPAPPPQFLGNACTVSVRLQNHSKSPRFGLALAFVDHPVWVWSELPAQQSITLQLSWYAPQRGRLALPAMTLESRFPMGAFRAWTVWRPASKVLVYPAPEQGAPALPIDEIVFEAGGLSVPSVQRDLAWDGLRPYRRGDSLKQIAWKPSAKTMASGSSALISRDRPAAQSAPLWLDYGNTGLTDKEARLSRLCAWARGADSQGLVYGLRLPGGIVEPNTGATHLAQCLEALALC